MIGAKGRDGANGKNLRGARHPGRNQTHLSTLNSFSEANIPSAYVSLAADAVPCSSGQGDPTPHCAEIKRTCPL
jgi:hypothetical protein